MTPLESVYFRSRLIHGDLAQALRGLDGTLDPTGRWVPYLKSGLVALGNLSDVEGSLRRLYREHPGLARAVSAIGNDLAFAKYLRNVFAGHINDDLVAKSYEWRPELRTMPDDRDPSGTVLLNLYVLETAINTYVADRGGHSVFSSETDLVYPPDMERFCEWLRDLLRSALAVCDQIGKITHREVAPLGVGAEMAAAFHSAGRTSFSRIRKRR